MEQKVYVGLVNEFIEDFVEFSKKYLAVQEYNDILDVYYESKELKKRLDVIAPEMKVRDLNYYHLCEETYKNLEHVEKIIKRYVDVDKELN